MNQETQATADIPQNPKLPKQVKREIQAKKELQLQLGALRAVADGAHKTAQAAVAALRGFVTSHLSLASINFEKKPVLAIIRVPEGQALHDEVGELMRQVLGVPVLELPAGYSVEALTDEQLEKVGFQRKVRLVDASGLPLAPGS